MSAVADATPPYIGRALERVEDRRLVTGAATYVDDIRLPGLLHAMILRSPHAHARIIRIDTAAAAARAGVVGVFTGADVNASCGAVPCAAAIPDLKAPIHTVLAGDRVYFVGHAVAIVVAADPYIARDAVAAIDVDYDPLPAVTDPEAAIRPGSPLTHPDLGTNVAFTHTAAGGAAIDEAFRNADRVITHRLRHQRLTPMPIEPRGVVASYHAGEGTLTVWTSTQIPHLLRTLLPGMIGIAENHLRIVAPEVGGGFGAKRNLYPEEALVAHLAMRLRAPVKWIESRRENAASTTHGRDQIGDYEVAVRNDGTILGIRARTLADLGAYNQLLTPMVPTLTGLMLTGCYRIPAVQIDLVGVYTHKMSTDAYRGAGRSEATYLIERLMDVVANELQLDRLDLRLKHFPAPTEFPFAQACGLTYDSGNYQAALFKARELAGWDQLMQERAAARAAGRLFGVGASTYVEMSAMGPSAAMPAGGWEWGSVRMEISGTVTVVSGVSPHGQGQETAFAQIAADRLGVPIEDVVVRHGDTDVAPFGRDTYGSRGLAVGGAAIVMSIDKVIVKAKRLAAHLLETTADHVEFERGVFSSPGVTNREIAWGELAAAAYVAKSLPRGFEPGLEASSVFEPSNFTFPFGTHICAVEIDRDTGEVTITKYVAVDDCGPMINPLLVEGQVQGGIAHAIGQVLFEQTVYDRNGQLLTGGFTDYPLPRAADIPNYRLAHTVTQSPVNPLGVKGVGEAATVGATPAIANAVLDALAPLGVRHLDLPMTPEKVWQAITSHTADRNRDSGFGIRDSL
jgi:aerobic carbon-monoxide dehydrogenase large subunit